MTVCSGSLFYTGLKSLWFLSAIGFIMCVSGEFLRKLAMWTASTNFNHEVQSVRADDHILVTHGVYKYMRHPSYVGWFIWSIGSQVDYQFKSFLCHEWHWNYAYLSLILCSILNFYRFCWLIQYALLGMPLLAGHFSTKEYIMKRLLFSTFLGQNIIDISKKQELVFLSSKDI